jgi:hypothetical protein
MVSGGPSLQFAGWYTVAADFAVKQDATRKTTPIVMARAVNES